MAIRAKKFNQKGYTLIELAVATAIMAVMGTTVIMANRFVNKESVANQDRTFATEKAIQMYEELRALVSGNEQLGVGVLEDYGNFSGYDTVLTTDKKVDTGLASANPADPLSGNIQSDGNWRYMRQIAVNVVANDTQAREVTVKVFLYPGDYSSQSKPGILLATVGGILRTSALPNVPTQVMDLYILQINNIPSWWSVLPTLAGYMQSDVADLESRLEGVQLRTHYITRSSYGRDYYYQPETNSFNNPAESTHQQWVYFYPGICPQEDLGAGNDFWYFDPQTNGDPNSLLMTGNFMVDGTPYPVSTSQFNGAETVSYSVADQYNNAMRYPDELAAYNAVTQAAAAFVSAGGVLQAGTTEISERMLLEGMLSQPASFQNSMIIDLHGELLPLPPIRNYSDAAKDPGNQMGSPGITADQAGIPMTCNMAVTANGITFTGNTNLRVVAHPELLYYPGAAASSDTVTVRYRVYAYYDGEDTGGQLPLGDPRVPAISLFFPDTTVSVVGVTAIVGNASSPWGYAYQSPAGPYPSGYSQKVPNDDPAASGPMSINIQQVGGNQQTLITLYNTPLRCGEEINPPTPNPNVGQGSGPNPNANPQVAPTHTFTPTPTNTYTPTKTPIPPTFTPTPTFTNGPCTIAYVSAVTFESDSASNASIPCTLTGVNNLLLAQINIQDNGGTQTVKSCYFGGQPMTQAAGFYDTNRDGGGQPYHGDLETWYITESAPVTGTLAVTINGGAATLVVGGLNYQGVDQNNPIGATATVNDQTSSTSHDIPINTTINDSWIVGMVEFNSTGGITPTGAGHTQRWYEQTNIDAEGDDMPTAAAGSYTLLYTTGSNHSADLEAVEILPCYIGPTPTPTITNTPVPIIPTNTPTNTATPPFTATPTRTGTITPSGGGIASGARLYGSEYIPCAPDVQSGTALSATSYTASLASGGYTFTSQDLTNTTNGAEVPKNTARWIISVAMPVTSVFSSNITIYSGAVTAGTAGATIVGCHALETRLGAAVTTSVVTVSGNPVTIYPNLSRTYVWCGDATIPPYTEQYQFMGDPRDCPYYDVKFGGVSITNAPITIGPNAYNWWFKNGNSGQQMAADGYGGFGASSGSSPWATRVSVDMPRYYQLVRQALLNTTSIWTTTNGWSWYYYGLGGEIGSDQSPRGAGVQMEPDIFMTSYNAGAPVSGYNNILGDGTWKNGLWVASNVNGSNAVTWYQRSWLGELYPDASYKNSWVSFGNLPSVANTTFPAGSQPETFYMEGMNNVKTAGPAGSSDDGFEGSVYLPNPQGTGANSFYDGNNATTGKTFEHISASGSATIGTELSLSVTTYNIYPFPLPELVTVNREWDLNGGNPPEWSMAPYNSASMRTNIDIPTVGGLSRIFYDYNQNGSLPTTSPYGSGVIRMTQTNTLPSTPVTQVGYVVETGTAPSGNVGAQTLAETSLVYAMRTFLDGGQMAATGTVGHIVQLPLVKIFLTSATPEYNESQNISFTVASPITMTSAAGAMTVGQPVTDIWWGYNPSGLASYYTEEYPGYGGAMTAQTGMYQESVSVIYNLKYSGNGGKTWFYAQDDAAAVTGVCDCNVANPSPAGHAVTNVAPWGYSWPVSTGTRILSQGVYELMVEAYRQNYGEHYSYDIQNLEVSW